MLDLSSPAPPFAELKESYPLKSQTTENKQLSDFWANRTPGAES